MMRKKCSFKASYKLAHIYPFPHFSYTFLFIYTMHVVFNDTHKRKISSIYNCWHIYNLLSIQKTAIFETVNSFVCF